MCAFFSMDAHASASLGAYLRLLIIGHCVASSAFNGMNCNWLVGTSVSSNIAATGHSMTHRVQSMHSSGAMASMFGPSRKASTGQTSTQSVYLHRIQQTETTCVM